MGVCCVTIDDIEQMFCLHLLRPVERDTEYRRAHMHSSLARGVKPNEGHKARLEFVPGCTEYQGVLPHG
jgi:hypothetical protein